MKLSPLLVVVLALAGCTGANVHPLSMSGALQVPRAVSEVIVELDRSQLAADRVERFLVYGGQGRVREAIVNELRQDGRLDPRSPATLHVTVNGFRLRSTATAFWFGLESGRDSLAAQVDMKVGGRSVREYVASSSSLRGTAIFAGAGGRFNNLARSMARKLVAELS